MDQIKIIFFDIDGTLVNMGTGKLSPKTVEALNRLKEKGILLCIATGRSPVTLPCFEGVEFDAFLTFNGSYCYQNETDIFNSPIPRNDVARILQNAKKLGKAVSIATKDLVVANGSDEPLEQYYAFAHLDLEVSRNFDEIASQDVYQIMLGCREAEYPAILEGAPGAKITAWWDQAADIIPACSGKGNGIRKMLDYFGLAPEQALAFGDGSNDIEMLRTVGTGIAMGNATAAVKAEADGVCGTAAEDGIYHYCLEQGLI